MENLNPHQIIGIEKIKRAFKTNRSFLVADQVGLGKTRQACVVAKDYEKVLIVAPLSTFAGWKREAAAVDLGLNEASIMWPGDGAVLINYEKLDKFKEIGEWNSEKKTYAAKCFDLIVFDECHKLSNTKSKRFKIFQSLNINSKHVLFLSATPGQSPLDLAYLREVIGFNSFWPWVRSFEGVSRNLFGGMEFKRTSAKDIARLRKIITDNPFAIRRTPSDLLGWPELQRIIYPIQLTAEQNVKYNNAFEDYLKEREDANLRGLHPDAYDMVATGQFRKAISFLKIDATVDLTVTLLEQDKVVGIACEYLYPAGEITTRLKKEGYRVGLITGDVLPERREELLRKSYNDELDVIVFTVTEGINLQQIGDNDRERVQLCHDLRWSGISQTQCEGRLHRAGRSAPIYYMTVSDTIDERVTEVLKKRLDTIADINNDFIINPDEFIFSSKRGSLPHPQGRNTGVSQSSFQPTLED